MKRALIAGATTFGLAMASVASATPVVLTGNFVQVGISDVGTLGSNFQTAPGMLHDPTGTGNFTPFVASCDLLGGVPGVCPNDYLTPGTPHESFGLNFVDSNGNQFKQNDNAGGADFATVSGPTVISLAGYDNAATWSGTLGGLLDVTNLYFFNDGDQRVNIRTTLTAHQALTNVAFGRSEDPDPDVNRFGNFSTNNTRGNGTLGAADLVTSRGSVSGLFLGLLNLSGNTFVHNTGISSFCCMQDDPNSVLPGYGALFPVLDVGDLGLQMAWSLGNMADGDVRVINYAYVFGDRIEDVVIDPGTPTPMPEPGTVVMFGTGLAGLMLYRRRRQA